MTFDINGIAWEVFEKPLSDTLFKDKNGLCDCMNNKIFIQSELNPAMKRKVLLHELAHAFIYVCLLVTKENYGEEELCEFVALYSPRINELANDYFQPKGERKK